MAGGVRNMNYRITNVDIVTMDDQWGTLTDSEIGIADGRIAYIGRNDRPKGKEQDWQEIDGSGMICMPGMINTHNHAAMSLMRGYADDLELFTWLQQKIWPLEARLTPEDVYWGTMLSIVEMLKSGTTCFADMYFHMEQVAKACSDTGIRAVLAYGIIGGRGEEADRKELEVGLQFALEWRGANDGLLQTMLAPHAPYTCPELLLRQIVEVAEQYGLGIHIHLSETEKEVHDIQEQYGMTPVAWVHSLGMLEQHVLAAHCVHVTEEEIGMLAKMRGGVAHDPFGNLKLASGIAPVADMLAAGVTVSLGTDGPASTNHLGLLKEVRLASVLQKHMTKNASAVPARQALQMATRSGGEALGMPGLGHLYPGAPADCILVDRRAAHMSPKHDLESLLAYSAADADVRHVWVAGQWVVKDGQCTLVDEAEVMRNAQKCVERLIYS